LRGHKPSGGGYLALCPCHPDKDPSLSINEEDGKLLVHCFGCGAGLPEVLDAPVYSGQLAICISDVSGRSFCYEIDPE